MVEINGFILHLQPTKDGGLLIRVWRSRRAWNWLICLLRHWVGFRLHMAAHQWQQIALIFGGDKGPIRFTEGKARCWWDGGLLKVRMGEWELDMTKAEASRLETALGRLTRWPND